MKNFFRILLCIIIIINTVFYGNDINIFASDSKLVTLYFIDSTDEKWIEDDNAKIVIIDNTHNHVSYDMELVGKYTWKAEIPESATNITYQRYNSTKEQVWNSFSAGGRDSKTIYLCKGHEYGEWISEEEYGFKEGDMVYLDVSDFADWVSQDNSTLYANFTKATKKENNGMDVKFLLLIQVTIIHILSLTKLHNIPFRIKLHTKMPEKST